jgi:hypothetical protein
MSKAAREWLGVIGMIVALVSVIVGAMALRHMLQSN